MNAASVHGLRVLIVDDEEDFARTLASRLELRGLAAECAFSAEQGLERLARGLPDLVLLDMRMPGLSGVDLLRRLRKERFTPGGETLPVIVVTGHCSESDAAEAEALGIQGYHAKPLDMDELMASISAAAHGQGRRP